ncbi:MAG: hypothetical protein CL583_15670 [Alteromonadaceae bacterium]|nr:hypothetical protein [Alteromonadaceae bacterium]|tara:strand:+ start:3807 stop:5681 length:1875 start_codon:yes stop_codon:yes gene_type:complete
MLSKRLKPIAILMLLLFLAACGGGGDDGVFGTGGGSAGGDGDAAGDFEGQVQLLTSSPRVGTADTEGVVLTALVKDSNGVLMEEVPVSFSVTNNGALQVTRGTTDETGSALAVVTGSGDYRNRSVAVTATAGGASSTVNIDVDGTTLTIVGPNVVPVGEEATFIISLEDSDGNGIAMENLTVESALNTTSATVLSTDADGTVTVKLIAGNSGTDTLSVSALDGSISASQNVEISPDSFRFTTPTAGTEIPLDSSVPVSLTWQVDGSNVVDNSDVTFSTTRGILSSATATTTNGTATVNIQASDAGLAVITATAAGGLSTQREVEFIATDPETLEAKSASSQLAIGESTEITAVVRDAKNNLVKNQTVTFQLTDISGGTLSSGSAVTNSQGIARTRYTAGQSTSSNGGVEIKAFIASLPSVEGTVNLTVSQQALRVSLGTGNEIEEPNSTTYRKPWSVFVSDATGAPIADAQVELSLLPIYYWEGEYVAVASTPGGTPDKWARSISLVSGESCVAEDLNGNGILDTGEDVNGNGTLEPTNPGTVPGRVTTNSEGSFEFGLNYPQSHCNWVGVELTAKVGVQGTETISRARFTLSCLADDLNNLDIEPPGGIVGLYGNASSCATPD